MPPLKLVALDKEDLEVLSAHLQDAVVRVADLAYLPNENRFAAIADRFDWEAFATSGSKASQRRQAALRFDRVLGAQIQKMPLDSESTALDLLAIHFDESEPPGGFLTLVFAGGSAIKLHIECIEAELRDLGPAWRTKHCPQHADQDEPASGT